MMPPPKEDPKFRSQQARLQIAMAQIRDVLTKYDIMGYVVLNDTRAAEFLLHLQASWSVAAFDLIDNQPAIRLRSKLSDYDGDAAEQKRCLEATVGAFFTLVHNLNHHAQQYKDLLGVISQHFPQVMHIMESIDPVQLDHPDPAG